MKIKQKRVKSINRVLNPLLPNTRFRVVVVTENLPEGKLIEIGFSESFRSGDSILPTAAGTVSDYNANGRYIIRRDLPKEVRYVTTIEWTWEEWDGPYSTVTRTDDRDVYRECYQRDFHQPPAAELTIIDHNGQLLVVSEELTNIQTQGERSLHIINLFLELFGECEIRHTDLQTITPPNIRKVNWALLPPGKYPWSQLQNHVTQVLVKKTPRYANPIYRRLEKLASFNPEEVYVGKGGFRSYVAYLFKAKGITVLESIMLDNATYVFDENWQKVSQMTKAQILQDNLHLERIIHTKNWSSRIDELLK